MPPHPNAHIRHNNHPVAQSAPPLRRGELYPATVRSQFPSIGGVARDRAPRDVSRGWFGRGGKRIHDYLLTLYTLSFPRATHKSPLHSCN